MVPIMTTELEVMPISPLVHCFDVDEPVIHGFGNLLCFVNVRVLPKPPWLLCVAIPRLWFKQTQLITGFLLKALLWVSDRLMSDNEAPHRILWSMFSTLGEGRHRQIQMELEYFINASAQGFSSSSRFVQQ
jgi:hypothetical protein